MRTVARAKARFGHRSDLDRRIWRRPYLEDSVRGSDVYRGGGRHSLFAPPQNEARHVGERALGHAGTRQPYLAAHRRRLSCRGGPPPVPKVISNSAAVRTRLVETGGFLTILPSSMLHFAAQRVRMKVLPVLRPARPQAAQVITLRNRTPNPIAKLFIDEVQAFAGPLASRRA